MNLNNEDLPERLQKLKKASETREPSERLKDLWQHQNNIYIEQSKPTEKESIHWERYKSKHLGEKYFSLDHIEDIGLPFDVAIVLSKRGTGKTHSFIKLIQKIAEQGDQFVVVRNTKQEIEGGVKEKIYEIPSMPFNVKQNKVYWADGAEEPVGYLAYLSGESQQWQGAGYDRVTTIIWDEATNGGQTTAKTRKWIRAFWQLTSTFFRNRPHGKVWIFGNLMKDSEEKISDELLKYLGIDSDLNFKYIINTTEQGTKFKLLYINTANLYIGADEQLMANVSLSKQVRLELASNLPSKMGECILSDHYFTKAKSKDWGLLTSYDKKDWMILIASEPYIDLSSPEIRELYLKGELPVADKNFYIIRCEQLRKGQIGFEMPIFTDDANLWNLNKDIAYFKKSENMKKMWYKLYKIIKSGYACYIGDSTYTDLTRIMSGRKDIINNYQKDRMEKIKKLKSAKKK